MTRRDKAGVPAEFSDLIDECVSLIVESGTVSDLRPSDGADPLPSLLEQCRALTEATAPGLEPVRTIHHFACTGGTLLARCLAAMPGTVLLSEVAPHSRLAGEPQPGFHPSDLIRLLTHTSRGSSEALRSEIFLRGLAAVHEECTRNGTLLVLREHSHSMYCTDDAVSSAPGLRSMLHDAYPLRSVVTVRHPLDSFLSLRVNDWVHFSPGSLDEYACRYWRFLDDHEGLPRFRYEDLVQSPVEVVAKICDALDLPFRSDFEAFLGMQRGYRHSGRSSDQIGRRARREVPQEVEAQARDSSAYSTLCDALGYAER